jgi:hypothetical protein
MMVLDMASAASGIITYEAFMENYEAISMEHL